MITRRENVAAQHSLILRERIPFTPASQPTLEPFIDQSDDLVPQPIVVSQFRRIFFSYDFVFGEMGGEVESDESLGSEVADWGRLEDMRTSM
jgi:hypothetical protein